MLRVISLGAGVQSTTMALMAAHGEIACRSTRWTSPRRRTTARSTYSTTSVKACAECERWLSSPCCSNSRKSIAS